MDDHHRHGEIGSTSGPGGLHTTTYRVNDGRTVVVAIDGEIDLLTAPAIGDTITRGLPGTDDTATVLVIDLSEVTFLSSKGIQLLLDTQDTAVARGVALRVVAGSHHSVLRPLQIAGLDTALAVFPTCDQALVGHDPATGSPPQS